MKEPATTSALAVVLSLLVVMAAAHNGPHDWQPAGPPQYPQGEPRYSASFRGTYDYYDPAGDSTTVSDNVQATLYPLSSISGQFGEIMNAATSNYADDTLRGPTHGEQPGGPVTADTIHLDQAVDPVTAVSACCSQSSYWNWGVAKILLKTASGRILSLGADACTTPESWAPVPAGYILGGIETTQSRDWVDAIKYIFVEASSILTGERHLLPPSPPPPAPPSPPFVCPQYTGYTVYLDMDSPSDDIAGTPVTNPAEVCNRNPFCRAFNLVYNRADTATGMGYTKWSFVNFGRTSPRLCFYIKEATRNTTCVSVPGYTGQPDVDSWGVNLGPPVFEPLQACNADPRCQAFNSGGWLKTNATDLFNKPGICLYTKVPKPPTLNPPSPPPSPPSPPLPPLRVLGYSGSFCTGISSPSTITVSDSDQASFYPLSSISSQFGEILNTATSYYANDTLRGPTHGVQPGGPVTVDTIHLDQAVDPVTAVSACCSGSSYWNWGAAKILLRMASGRILSLGADACTTPESWAPIPAGYILGGIETTRTESRDWVNAIKYIYTEASILTETLRPPTSLPPPSALTVCPQYMGYTVYLDMDSPSDDIAGRAVTNPVEACNQNPFCRAFTWVYNRADTATGMGYTKWSFVNFGPTSPGLCFYIKEATRNTTCVSVPGYTGQPDVDSWGVNLGAPVFEPLQACNADPRCQAFNSGGWLKTNATDLFNKEGICLYTKAESFACVGVDCSPGYCTSDPNGCNESCHCPPNYMADGLSCKYTTKTFRCKPGIALWGTNLPRTPVKLSNRASTANNTAECQRLCADNPGCKGYYYKTTTWCYLLGEVKAWGKKYSTAVQACKAKY